MPDDYHKLEVEARPEDMVKAIFNAIDRGPRKTKKLIDAEAKKKKIAEEKISRANRDKLRRAARRVMGKCTRCGEAEPAEGRRMCEDCQEEGRNYLKGV